MSPQLARIPVAGFLIPEVSDGLVGDLGRREGLQNILCLKLTAANLLKSGSFLGRNVYRGASPDISLAAGPQIGFAVRTQVRTHGRFCLARKPVPGPRRPDQPGGPRSAAGGGGDRSLDEILWSISAEVDLKGPGWRIGALMHLRQGALRRSGDADLRQSVASHSCWRRGLPGGRK